MNKMHLFQVALLLLPAGASIAQNATAEAATVASKQKDAFERLEELTQVDITVPTSPAFAVLGLSPEKIQRPGMIRAFVVAAARGLGTDGKIAKAAAVDASPASILFRKWIIGGTDYGSGADDHSDLHFHNWPKRVLARTTVSFATTEPDSDGAAKLAFGVRMGLIDSGDPGLYATEVARCLRSTQMPDMAKGKNLDSVQADPALSRCDPTQDKALSLWAKPALYAGFGKSWYSKSGRLTDRAPDVKALWLTYSQGIVRSQGTAADDSSELRTLVQGYVGRRLDDRVSDPSGSANLLRRDSSEVIVRLRSGKSNWHGYFEIGKTRGRIENNITEQIRHYALGAEFKLRLSDDMWLQIGSVNERGYADGKDRNSITTNLRLGAPFLNIPGPK
jgi:hypothetical protein